MGEIAGLLHAMMPIGAPAEVPSSVTASITGGVWKRLKAVYANGWEVVVNFDACGEVSSTTAKLKLTVSARTA